MGGYDVIYNKETAWKMFGSLGLEPHIAKNIVRIEPSFFAVSRPP